jgi:N-acetyl-anhydromuramyl-L-alanine amidase AmpD
MKQSPTRLLQTLAKTIVMAASIHLGAAASASTDYPPALWNPAYSGHWYTTGSGHKFVVIHDMEGYYLSTISYFQRSDISVSAHYLVNGLKDNSSDHPAGEITQMVREAYYAWHARCWNTHSFGTEHEGFVSNPAWFTEAMYQASADLQRHLCNDFSIAKDRNHVVGHDQKRISGWPAYASANLGIDPYCNDHTDPGSYWDWTHFMDLITATRIVDNASSGFSASTNWWTSSNVAGYYGANYSVRWTQAVSDTAYFRGVVPSAGRYNVYAWWTAASDRTTAAPFFIYDKTGNYTRPLLNQTINGGKWNLLGTFDLNAGTNLVRVGPWTSPIVAGKVVVADAIKWVKTSQ